MCFFCSPFFFHFIFVLHTFSILDASKVLSRRSDEKINSVPPGIATRTLKLSHAHSYAFLSARAGMAFSTCGDVFRDEELGH